MIAVGIPTFNEADNIRHLVEEIDRAALALEEPVIIINADNASKDGTAEIFRSTCTTNEKVSLITEEKGKGRNVLCILDYITAHALPYCFLVDGDVTSMEPEWLKKHILQAYRGTDYVVPNYARFMQEGNATNHVFFPLLNTLSKGRAPYQPIAGDIGISSKLATHLKSIPWHRSTFGYGVDIFITMHALFHGFNVVEISLGKKIHKPSYEKMITIFEEEVTSYFEARKSIERYNSVNFTREEDKPFSLLLGNPLSREAIEERAEYARTLLIKNANASICTWPSSLFEEQHGLDAQMWSNILAEHEKKRFIFAASALAKSLLPFYLLRVVTYLRQVNTPSDAETVLAYQTALIAEHFALAGL
jgi:glycosyltransferase involved in cell wall biosynthesis